MEYREKTVKSETIYSGRVITLKIDTIEMPNQKYSKREIVEHPGAVVILPVLPDGKILFVHNYRTAVSKSLLELPAGLIEYAEEPKDTAKRELLEETGYEASELTYLFDAYSSPGFTNEKWQMFLATGLEKVTDEIDPEIQDHSTYTLAEALDLIDNFRVSDSKTIMGCLYLSRKWEQHFPNSEEGVRS